MSLNVVELVVKLGVVDGRDHGDEAQNPRRPEENEFPVAFAGHCRFDEPKNGKEHTDERPVHEKLFHRLNLPVFDFTRTCVMPRGKGICTLES